MDEGQRSDVELIRLTSPLLAHVPDEVLSEAWGSFSTDCYAASWMGLDAETLEEFWEWLARSAVKVIKQDISS